MTQSTSIEALKIYKPQLGKKCAELYHLYRTYGDMTDNEIADRFGWKVHLVSARRNGLIKHIDLWGEKRPLICKKIKVYINGYPSWKWGLIGDGQMEMGV